MTNYRILVVDDEEDLCEILKFNLETEGYEVDTANSAEEALKKDLSVYNLLMLDVMMGEISGFKMANIIRKDDNKAKIPIIFLTAKDEEDNIVKGLELGAEDYITKPFSIKELMARINRIILRNKKNTIIQVQNIKFDMDKMVVYRDNENVELTNLELKILNLLFLNLNKVVKRSEIIDKIWEWTGNDVNDNTVTVYLKRIREKIKTDIIITIKGIGYRIDSEVY